MYVCAWVYVCISVCMKTGLFPPSGLGAVFAKFPTGKGLN